MNRYEVQSTAQIAQKPLSSRFMPQVNISPFSQMAPVQEPTYQVPQSLADIEREFMRVGELVQLYQKTPKRINSRIRKKEKEVRLGAVTFRPSRGDWQCSHKKCRNWNYAKRTNCNVCKSPKDDVSEEEDEWECTSCGFGNLSHKTLCFKCGKKNTDSLLSN